MEAPAIETAGTQWHNLATGHAFRHESPAAQRFPILGVVHVGRGVVSALQRHFLKRTPTAVRRTSLLVLMVALDGDDLDKPGEWADAVVLRV